VAVASAVVTAVAALLLLPGPEPASSPPDLAALNSDGPPASRTAALLRERFAVFRRAALASDRVRVATNKRPNGDVDAGYVRENGMDVALGRRLRSAPRVFAIPGRGSVCLVHEDSGGECSPVKYAHRNFQTHTCGHTAPGRYEVTGLVPDWADAVLLRLRNGRRVRLPVKSNFVDVTRPAGVPSDLPASVELRTGAAMRSASVPRLTMRSLACGNLG
jgi:hypothetical protein